MENLFQNYTPEKMQKRREAFEAESKKRLGWKKRAPDFEYQELCLEMEQFFPKNEKNIIWTLPFKIGYTEEKIRKAFDICKKKNVRSVRYVIGIIKNLPY